MKFIYDQAGKRIAEYFDSSSTEDIQKDYVGMKIFISELDLGENAIVENNQIRAETRLDRILNKTEELQEGEYIENGEIKYKEKPNNYHFWDSNKEEWVYDQGLEIKALEEAKKLGIPVVALIDTNVDPDLVTYKIPANDDAIRSVKLFSEIMANAIIEGNNGQEAAAAEAQVQAEEQTTEETVVPNTEETAQ